MEVVAAVGVLIALALLWFSARAAVTVCVLQVATGKIEVVRGALSPRVLSDLADVVRRPKVEAATIRIVKNRGRAEVLATGSLTDSQLQQLRNVVGSVPLAKLENVRAKKR